MYPLIGLPRLFAGYAGFAAVVAVATFLLWPSATPTHLWGWREYIGAPVGVGLTAASALVAVLGQTCLFPQICRLPGLRDILPALDGRWEGELQSNWPRTQQGGALKPAGLLVRPATMTIKARLLSVSVVLDTQDGYSTSKAVLVGVARDAASDRCRLAYIYENTTPNQEQTDESSHLGAAMLTLDERGGQEILQGRYWTNRNWSRGLNTAGIACFRKVA